jgi:hypothetical protein
VQCCFFPLFSQRSTAGICESATLNAPHINLMILRIVDALAYPSFVVHTK